MLNKVMLIGNLGGDPEMRYTNDGAAIANFSVATSETWKDSNGEKQEKTEWHKVVAFKKLAEVCGEYLKKGKQVYIEGKIQTRSWEDNEGNTRYSTEIVARTMNMLGHRSDEPGSNKSEQPPKPPQDNKNADQDDGLPF